VDAASVIEGVLAADRRAVARAISMVEDGAGELPELSAGLFPRTGRAWTVGLTGAPGVGKSSLAAALVRSLRERDHRVAVLAIDPTSPFSGGALLGDRVRMQDHATDPGVFIRSMATRGHLGGMALAAPEAVRVLDAAGFDVVVVETVGAGQAELEVATATDSTLVVLAPGWGDGVQAAKAGILEIADIFVVNKAEQEGAAAAVREIKTMMSMGEHGAWVPSIVRTTATSGEGVDELWAAIERHREHLESTGAVRPARDERLQREVEGMAAELLKRRAEQVIEGDADLAQELRDRRIDPYRAAELLIERAATSRE